MNRPGWYADPEQPGQQRYWDGTAWTEHRRPAPGTPTGLTPRLLAIVGGGIGGLIVLVLLIVVVAKAVGGSGPESVAETYLKGEATLDYETECELDVEEDRQDWLDSYEVDDCAELNEAKHDEIGAKAVQEYDDHVEIDVQVEEPDRIGKGEALVDWRVTARYTGDDPERLEDLITFDERSRTRNDGTMLLCEEADGWKVSTKYYDEDEDSC